MTSVLLAVAALSFGAGFALVWSRLETFRAYRNGFMDGDRAGWLRAVRLTSHRSNRGPIQPAVEAGTTYYSRNSWRG